MQKRKKKKKKNYELSKNLIYSWSAEGEQLEYFYQSIFIKNFK